MKSSRIPRRLAALAIAVLCIPAAAETISRRAFLDMVGLYLYAPAEDRASGQLRGEAARVHVYISEFLAKNDAVARCLPVENRMDVAALLIAAAPQGRLSSFFGDGESILREAIAPGGQCRYERGFTRAVLRATATAGVQADLRKTAHAILADALLAESRGDQRHAACLDLPRTREVLTEAAAAYLATLPSNAGEEAEFTAIVAQKAVERACDPPAASRDYGRDGADPDASPAAAKKPTCKREGGFSPLQKTSLQFPRNATQFGIERASIVVNLRVDAEGRPVSSRVVSVKPSHLQGVFDRAASDALLQWRWPAGCPFIAEFELNFKLTD
ncbi:hypothetical protein BWI17_20805 [Betaproteobacteria bacterium GR16-43]|nr:hypothetical protein BWI17_20805 [Betaproteobacteria bacterium GR16-43]